MDFTQDKDVNDYARYIFNTVIDDVKTTLSFVGKKVEERQVMHLIDAYCCGYLFLLTLKVLERYGANDKAAKKILKDTFVDIGHLLVVPSGELAVGSDFVSQYPVLRNEWFNADPLSNPMSYINQLVNDEFKVQSLEVVLDCYSHFQDELDRAFNTK